MCDSEVAAAESLKRETSQETTLQAIACAHARSSPLGHLWQARLTRGRDFGIIEGGVDWCPLFDECKQLVIRAFVSMGSTSNLWIA